MSIDADSRLANWIPVSGTPPGLRFYCALTDDPDRVEALRPLKPNTFLVLLVECKERRDKFPSERTEMLYCVFTAVGATRWIPVGGPEGFVTVLSRDKETALRLVENDSSLKVVNLSCEQVFSGRVENPVENWWCAVKK